MNKKVLVCLMALMASVCSWGDTDYSRNGITATYSGTVLTISAGSTGVMPNYIFNSAETTEKAPWNTVMTYITEVIINEGITYIGKDAFRGASSITKITLPVSLDSIGADAFTGCTSMADIYYKGTPAQWVSIGLFHNYSHPFRASDSANRKLYFYGNTSSASDIVFIEPTITKIKQQVFNKVTSISCICIPGTVESIGDYAFYNCSGLTEIIINRHQAPSVGTSAFYGIAGGTASNVQLYKPSTNSGYNVSPWNTFVKALGETFAGATSGNLSEGSIPWTLDENGILTIDATNKATKSITFNLAGKDHPWGRFRRMVYKIKIKGEMTGIGNILRYHYGLSEIIIDQTTNPTAGEEVAVNTVGGIPYNSLYNQRDKLKLSIKQVSLTDESVTNLESAPWSNNHWQVQLAEPAVIADNADYTTLLSNIHTYVEKPFDLQINRQLVNGIYNTFCSPVAISADKIEEIWGVGTELYEMSESAGEPEEEGDVVMNFVAAESITAGKPYLIKRTPADNEDAVASFTIENINPGNIVTEPSSVNNGDITFYGTLAPRDVTEDEVTNKSFIILTGTVTDDGQLLNWANGGTFGGMRAYWKLNGGGPAKIPVMRFTEKTDIETGVENVQGDNVPCTKVMRDGQLYIMYKGTMYNVQGQKIGNW